jgi:hypothetical protein
MRPRMSATSIGLLAALSALAGGFGVAAAVWTATSAWSFPTFVVLVCVVLLLPGGLLIEELGVAPAAWLERLSLSLAAGIPLGCGVFAACVAMGVPNAFRVWPLMVAMLATHRRFRARWSRWRLPEARPAHLLLVLVLAAVLAPLLFLPLFFRNLARLRGGGLALYTLPDVILHGSIARELTHSFPPQNPFLPGHPLSYHYGMDLLAALFTPFGLDTMDLTVRFVPLLLLTFLVLATFTCARAWPLPEPAAALVAVLVVLGEDFSFLPGLAVGSPQPWAVHFFGMPTTLSLYLLNPMLPAVAFLMSALLAVRRSIANDQRGGWILVGFLSAVLIECKVFVGMQWLAALGLTALLYAALFRRTGPLWAAAAAAVSTTPLAVALVLANGGRIEAAVLPWPYVPAAFERMGLGQTYVGRLAGEFYLGHGGLVAGLVFFGLALPLYLLLTFGARSLGGARCLRSLVCPAPEAPTRWLVAVFVVIGPVLTLLLAVSPAGYPNRQYYNDAVWFFVASKHVLWLFAVEAVAACASRRRAFVAAAFLVASSLPSTFDRFARDVATHPILIDARAVRMLDFVRERVPPGSTCLAEEPVAEALIVSTSCRALALDVFAHSFLSPREQDELRATRDAFWSDWRRGNLRFDMLGVLHADYLVVLAPPGTATIPLAAPGGGLRLDPIHRDSFAVMRVVREGG